MVFYLKYRPQKIDELDSEEVRVRLSKILSSDNLPHAFLFTGSKGLGKTSTARIIAKVVNCENRKKGDFEPCGKCSSCVSIASGTNFDVIEIDAASNRGIDEIRDLREKIRLSPVSSKKKVYIIDEVHMLTSEAFNALLKTLEEPPAHAIFILCTTEPQKVPGTIISRCLHISFKSPTSEEMKRSYARIIKGEGLNIDDDGLDSVLKLSDGSFRDGAKVLEEISVNFGTKKVGREEIEKNFNISTINDSTQQFVAALITKDTKEALKILDNLSKQKSDFRFFADNFLSFLHDLLMLKFEIPTTDKRTESFLKENDPSVLELKEIIEVFSQAYSQMKFSVTPQIPLEIAVIEYCSEKEEIQEKPAEKILSKPAEIKKESKPISNDDKILEDLIVLVNSENRSVAGLLRGVRLGKDEEDAVELVTAYKFHKERLDEAKTKNLIENAYEQISGKKKRVEIILKI